MHIIKTDVVSSKFDVFWEDAVPNLPVDTHKAVLVIGSGCVANTPEDGQMQKMLEGCKLKNEQYYILRINKDQELSWHRLREKINPEIVFLIGVMPAQLGIAALF